MRRCAMSISAMSDEANWGEKGFNKILTARDLTMIGVGSIIGSGIFVMSGQAAALYAGPAVVL